MFGETHVGEVRKKGARRFLRNTFGPTADVFAARLDDSAFQNDIKNVLWADLLKPHALVAAGLTDDRLVLRPEGEMVWSHLTHNLVQHCLEAVQFEHV